jgi:hypothetical protein
MLPFKCNLHRYWAGYLAAAAAVSAWRELAAARDAAAALDGGRGTGVGGGANLAADAAEAALDAILSLAAPREEDDGFYGGGSGGHWLESPTLMDAAEAAAAASNEAPPAIRLIAIALPRGAAAGAGAGAVGAGAAGAGAGAGGTVSPHYVAGALREVGGCTSRIQLDPIARNRLLSFNPCAYEVKTWFQSFAFKWVTCTAIARRSRRAYERPRAAAPLPATWTSCAGLTKTAPARWGAAQVECSCDQ